MEEVRAIKPSSTASAAPVKATPLILPEPSDAATSASNLLSKGNKDPRKSASATTTLLNNRSSATQMISTTASATNTTTALTGEKSSKSLAKKVSIDELMSESTMTNKLDNKG